MYKETFAKKLKKARERTGFTQADVEKETGISRVNIARYETGTREPDIETLGKLIDFYGISAEWLIGTGIESNRTNHEKTQKRAE